jgi:hypothetical protein
MDDERSRIGPAAPRSPAVFQPLVSSRVSSSSIMEGADSVIQASLPAPARPQLPEVSEKGLRLQQILGVEALGEPVVDRGQQLIGVLAPALALP